MEDDRPPTAAELEASAERRILRRNQKIAELRERSGLSMDELAKEMGYKGQSSIQRYLSPDYDKGFRPELAARFKAALIGKGSPPITPRDLHVFDSWTENPDGTTVDMLTDYYRHLESGGSASTYRETLEERGIYPASHIDRVLSFARKSKGLDADPEYDRVTGLPLREGDVVLKMPKRISAESAETIRGWVEHLLSIATAEK